MAEDIMRFVAVEFVNDENVKGNTYWYLCPYAVSEGGRVIAPLGRHNRLQEGIVRRVLYADEYSSPYPLYLIKQVGKVVSENEKAE